MPASGTYGSVRGVPGNGHPYRDLLLWLPLPSMVRTAWLPSCTWITRYSSGEPRWLVASQGSPS